MEEVREGGNSPGLVFPNAKRFPHLARVNKHVGHRGFCTAENVLCLREENRKPPPPPKEKNIYILFNHFRFENCVRIRGRRRFFIFKIKRKLTN